MEKYINANALEHQLECMLEAVNHERQKMITRTGVILSDVETRRIILEEVLNIVREQPSVIGIAITAENYNNVLRGGE